MALPSLYRALEHRKGVPFPPGYPETHLTFYSPVDDVHGALCDLLNSAAKSLVIAMYGYDDDELNAIFMEKLHDPTIFCQLTLDSSQARVPHERAILNADSLPSNSIAIGRSEKGAIMHMKTAIVDMLDVADGSTNWSGGGEAKQDNQLTIFRDLTPGGLIVAETRTRIDMIHTHMRTVSGMSIATPRWSQH